ncbi:nucleotidyltransferase domain-containing protein [Demequina sp. TTPB684]|uniref:nucleotidyltransferase domain-containing protein n=1 Tax=unclassified Demequina TaxID=2620311 RepID=UPI001CF444B0|nr:MULTISPECIES: nucleotidyltransferase domain-containing protein [unclassified Demequina]MCB2412121.1 nucleotidyltransferase domain-containing protein [Demequina sp. TTPB684]UPU88908.1 nucleotidyltransferase domain-containing protein [Demequina sp. TMPB413]
MQLQSPFAVLTPTLDGEILAVLARIESSLTVGQIQSLLPDRSDEGIRKALRRLSAQGIVDSERVSSVIGHRLNRRHLAAPQVIAIARLRDALVERMQENLEAWPTPPRWTALFGSAARGEMRVDSDIDLFLVDPGVDAELWETLTSAFAADVSAWTGNDLRILSLTEPEVRLGAAKRDPIIESLLADALVVSGPTDWLRRTARSARR